MKFIQSFLLQLKNQMRKKKKIESPNLSNPFIKGAEGRREWNDRYFNMRKAIQRWQAAFFSSLAIVALFAFFILKMAAQSRVEPFVVEMYKGEPYAIKPMTKLSLTDERLIHFALNQFITNTRSILKDLDAQKVLLKKAYAFAADDALHFLKQHYAGHDPRAESSSHIVEVQVINTLPISSKTWQVTWDEIKKDSLTGQVKESTRWLSQLTYEFGPVNTDFIEYNPFGLYITHMTWSKNQSQLPSLDETHQKEPNTQDIKEPEIETHALNS